MKITRRVVLASCSVAIIAVVVAIGSAYAPDAGRSWLRFCGFLGVIAAVQSVASDPRDLTAALLLSLPPVLALLADGSPTWLIGPLGALLLLASELGALSWDCRGPAPMGAVMRRRLLYTGQLGSLALAASLMIGLVTRGPSPGGTAAVVVAATALAAVGGVVFRRSA